MPPRSLGHICKCKQSFWTLCNSFFHYLYLRGIYLHMSHQTSKKVFCQDTLSKLWHSNKLYKVGDNFCTSPHQDIDPKDNLGHSVLCLSNNNQDGKYHIFAERNICCKHEHSAYIHYWIEFRAIISKCKSINFLFK